MESKGDKKINAVFAKEKVIADDNDLSREFYDKSRLGEKIENKFEYSLVEGLYLLEKGKLSLKDYKKKKLKFDDYVKKAQRINPGFLVKYNVFKDMRNRGYIVKTALKFGADFRVYDRGVKPGDDHAKWILYPVHESEVLTWHAFSAKNRVAHSTRKNLLIGVVDDESDVTYYQVSWTRP